MGIIILIIITTSFNIIDFFIITIIIYIIVISFINIFILIVFTFGFHCRLCTILMFLIVISLTFNCFFIFLLIIIFFVFFIIVPIIPLLFVAVVILLVLIFIKSLSDGFLSCGHVLFFFFFLTIITSEAFITITCVWLDALSIFTWRITFGGTSVFSSLHHPLATFTVIDGHLGVLLGEDVALLTCCSAGITLLETTDGGIVWGIWLTGTFLGIGPMY